MKFNRKKPEFIRFGGLSPVIQKGYTTSESERYFHTPPARKGIYAFPRGYIEPFLLGGDCYINPKNKNATRRVMYVRDKDGNVITDSHPEYDSYDDNESIWSVKVKLKEGAKPDEEGDYWFADYEHALVKRVHPRKFIYHGDIWHHLDEHCKEIKKSVGSWVLTTMDEYCNAFGKYAIECRKESIKMAKSPGSSPIIQRPPFDWFSKDHLEVFIERLK